MDILDVLVLTVVIFFAGLVPLWLRIGFDLAFSVQRFLLRRRRQAQLKEQRRPEKLEIHVEMVGLDDCILHLEQIEAAFLRVAEASNQVQSPITVNNYVSRSDGEDGTEE